MEEVCKDLKKFVIVKYHSKWATFNTSRNQKLDNWYMEEPLKTLVTLLTALQKLEKKIIKRQEKIEEKIVACGRKWNEV